MASSATVFVLSTLLLSLFLLPCAAEEPTCPFVAIYQLGDSIADTGNLIRSDPAGARSYASKLPYGESYFHRPTGRFSDGLLMIDYFAMALQLPLLNPYLDRSSSFDHGVNFAVAGSTALNNSFFAARNLKTLSNISLSVQVNWFRAEQFVLRSKKSQNSEQHFSQCSDCARKLRRSLVMVGEIGGNDYNYAFFRRKSIQEIRTYNPDVVGAIVSAVREVIRLGAVRVVVPGNFPVGCFPIYLTAFPNRDPRAYDDKGCLRGLNAFALSHNYYLQRALTLLRVEFPDAVILYADYYTAFQSVLIRAQHLGFEPGLSLRACCGTGGLYNYDGNMMCGSPGVPVCPNPDRHISWDGIHLTQNAYRHMSEFLINDILSRIQCTW